MKKYVLTNINKINTGFLFDDNNLEEIHCYEEESLLGNIYVARVSNILKNINAAFVDIYKGESCYLPLEDLDEGHTISVGDIIVVQVVKDRIKTKQATVSTKISITGEYVVVNTDSVIGISSKIKSVQSRKELKQLIGDTIKGFDNSKECNHISYGALARTRCEKSNYDDIARELNDLLNKLDTIMKQSSYRTAYSCLYENMPSYIIDMIAFNNDNIDIVTDISYIYEEARKSEISNITFSDNQDFPLSAEWNLTKHIEKALSKKVFLKSGGYLIVEPTEAMTVVDVNSGKSVKGNNSEENIYKLNVEAAYELARQLRIRNISGIIIVDFINMKTEALNKKLMDELRSACESDKVPVQVVDMTRLGLVELTRKKVRKPLYEMVK